MGVVLASSYLNSLEGLDESACPLDCICVERNSRWTGYASVPVGEADGARQAYFAARDPLTGYWVDWIICCGEGRVLCFHPRVYRARDYGYPPWKYVNWAFVVAGIADCACGAVLASSVRMIRV